MTWNTGIFETGFPFLRFWGQKVQQLNSRWLGWSWFKGLSERFAFADSHASFFFGILTMHPCLQYTPSTNKSSGKLVRVFESDFLHPWISSSSWVWLSITHEATGATTLLKRWVGSDHFELVVWLPSHHYKYNPLRMGIQGSKTLDLFVLLSKNAHKNYQRFCLKGKILIKTHPPGNSATVTFFEMVSFFRDPFNGQKWPSTRGPREFQDPFLWNL